jgi:sugar O-acyltransferase (sialic acid O-acetyltransferase NeuD family)
VAQPLLVVGVGGFARETIAAVLALGDEAPYTIAGVLDDDPSTHGRRVLGVPVLGPVTLVQDSDASVVVGTGNPRDYASRARIVARCALPADRYATIVHPAAHLGAGTTIGAGTVILAGVVATCEVSIGHHVAVMPHVTLTHDDHIEDYATLTSGVALGGGVTVGRGAYLGARATVREGVSVGEWSLLGMGSLLLHDLPPSTVAYGAPAVPVRAAQVQLPDTLIADLSPSPASPPKKEHLA